MALSELRSVFQRGMSPLVEFLVRNGVSPNAITTFGTFATVVGGGFYARGHIHLAGWIVGLSALCDMLDGQVARRSGRSSVFGAFYDSTLDRVADGAVLGGLAIFFARNGVHHEIPNYMSTPMVSVILLGMIGSFLTSYTRARAEGLGIDAQVGILQRPERIVLLSAPQAFFGLAFGGWVLMAICALLTVTAWITVVQRVAFVARVTADETRSLKPVQRSSGSGEIEAYEAGGRRADGVVLTAERLVRATEDLEPRLADVAAPAEPVTRRAEAGPTGFDRAR
ncbi:MAG TPA: CDP-alcohol phosphatidyltransferase family protein [Gemmatimonadaceae bacterium]|nr:CDP-alcohol phosphatidyltransferase family protein [Gemmatimonadaceae bacterium]